MFVDDEPQILGSLRASLYKRRKDWDMHFMLGGENVPAMFRNFHVGVPVTGLHMPGVDRTTLLARAKTEYPDTILPDDVPAYDRTPQPMDDEMLTGIGFTDSWQSLLGSATKLLNAGEAA